MPFLYTFFLSQILVVQMKTDLKTDSVAVTSDTPGEHSKTTRSNNHTQNN